MTSFFQMLEDNLCRNFSNITCRKQTNVPSNLQTDHKKQIFLKELQSIVYFVSAMVKRYAG